MPHSAWMGALFSAEWGNTKTRAEEEEEEEEEEARNGSRNGLKFIAAPRPRRPRRAVPAEAEGER